MTDTTAKLYRTAQVALSCAGFPEGSFVAVRYIYTSAKGTHWFDISHTQGGHGGTAFPEQHLTAFTF